MTHDCCRRTNVCSIPAAYVTSGPSSHYALGDVGTHHDQPDLGSEYLGGVSSTRISRALFTKIDR